MDFSTLSTEKLVKQLLLMIYDGLEGGEVFQALFQEAKKRLKV